MASVGESGMASLALSGLDARHVEGTGQGLGEGVELGHLDFGLGVEHDEEDHDQGDHV